LLPVIGGVAVVILLCGVLGIWAGLPFLKEMLATATPTVTATLIPTATMVAPTATFPPPPTQPAVIPPTEIPLPPTEVPIVIPPSEIPSPTAAKTAFKVTVQNNISEPIWAFRDGTIMGTSPIPPGKYIWYLNIPAGQHYFRFCLDMSQSECVQENQVMVDQDITITVQ
jgi:hypothetical protein